MEPPRGGRHAEITREHNVPRAPHEHPRQRLRQVADPTHGRRPEDRRALDPQAGICREPVERERIPRRDLGIGPHQ